LARRIATQMKAIGRPRHRDEGMRYVLLGHPVQQRRRPEQRKCREGSSKRVDSLLKLPLSVQIGKDL